MEEQKIDPKVMHFLVSLPQLSIMATLCTSIKVVVLSTPFPNFLVYGLICDTDNL